MVAVNVEFLVVAYFVSLFIDWVFQSQWQAENKSKWSKDDMWDRSLNALFSHSAIYALLTTLTLMLFFNSSSDVALTFVVLYTSHAIIDTRIPVKLIMKFKGMTNEQINDYQNYGFMHIGIDHRLHELVLFILSIII